jgi:mannose-6-phosphate isomerase-like protein (cupin superfamily)
VDGGFGGMRDARSDRYARIRWAAHVHPDEDDAFYIVEGEMTFIFGDERAIAPPGTFVLVPPRRRARLPQ